MKAGYRQSEQHRDNAGTTLTPSCANPPTRLLSVTAGSAAPSKGKTWSRQVCFMRERYPDAEIVSDIGGGLDFRRKGLVSLLERLHRGDKLRMVVAHRDRLARFGFELIQWLAEQNGGGVLVLNNADYSPEQELTQDILAILHTFSCRLHGLRRYKDAIKADSGLSGEGATPDTQVVV